MNKTLRRRSGVLALVLVALSGCATLNELRSEVTAYSQWPAGRAPGHYRFERLPSQQARAAQQQLLEDAARGAIEAAGFKPAAAEAPADVSIQLDARADGSENAALFNDPFWYGGGGLRRVPFGFGWGGRPWSSWGLWGGPPALYDREVVLLIRDRRSGELLYEAHASNEGGSPSLNTLLGAMFAAALKDFPAGNAAPHAVVAPLTP